MSNIMRKMARRAGLSLGGSYADPYYALAAADKLHLDLVEDKTRQTPIATVTDKAIWLARYLVAAEGLGKSEFHETARLVIAAFKEQGCDLKLQKCSENITLQEALAEAEEAQQAMILAERILDARRQNKGRALNHKQSRLTKKINQFIRGGEVKP